MPGKNIGDFKRDFTPMLPPDAYEMLGKAAAERFETYTAKLDAMIAKQELHLERLTAQVERKLAEVKDGAPGEKGDRGEKGDNGKDGIITQKVAAYRGVWDESQTYDLGDFVTLGGSLWHCNAQTFTNLKPGTDDVWTLAVKRGRDGKDGKNGSDGEPGPQGPKGDKGEIGYA
jgi:hypothetical protein